LIDADGNPAGVNLQECALCQRHRWFVRDHARGDADLGMIEKRYQIIAAQSA
jgi:hypothetical protein